MEATIEKAPTQMIDDESINKLAQAIAKATTGFPLSVALWDSDTVAAYLNLKTRQFKDRIAPKPDFPAPIRWTDNKGHDSAPMYKASEIIEWAQSQQKKKPR